VKEIDDAAEWYFQRDRYESLMVHAADLSEEREEDSNGDLDSASTESGDLTRTTKPFAAKRSYEKRKKVGKEEENCR
jgi:hypothetical protein